MILPCGFWFVGRQPQVLQRQNLLAGRRTGEFYLAELGFAGRPLQVLQAQNLLVELAEGRTGEFYPAELVLSAVRFKFCKAKLASGAVGGGRGDFIRQN